MIEKNFTIKIFNKTKSSLLATLSHKVVKNTPTFKSRINQGFGECELDLNLPFDDFGEGAMIDFMNIVEIHEADEFHPQSRLIYSGFISSYSPYIDAATSGVTVTLLGLVSLLKFAYYKDGSSFTVAHYSQDPAVIMKSIIDHFNAVIPGGLLGYDSGITTVDTVGVNSTYTFEEDLWLDALQNAFGTVGAGWWWVVDHAGQLYLKQKPVSATHVFTIGKNVQSISTNKTNETVVNSVLVRYSAGEVTVSDLASITAFGKRESIISDSRIINSATANQRASQAVNDHKAAKVRATLVVNLAYDLESIKVGDTCMIRNLSSVSSTFNDNMQIVEVRYDFQSVTLELEDLYTSFGLALKKFTA